jgi:hypothetical protein
VSIASVDKGPNSQPPSLASAGHGSRDAITKGVSHIAITLTDTAPPGAEEDQGEDAAEGRRATPPKTKTIHPTATQIE